MCMCVCAYCNGYFYTCGKKWDRDCDAKYNEYMAAKTSERTHKTN